MILEQPRSAQHPPQDITLHNANIVLPDQVFLGSIHIRDGHITTIGHTTNDTGTSIDCEGDYVVAGLVDLHTDNVEHHFFPRPGVEWPSPISAILAHDVQMLGAGITTVFDSLSLGDYESSGKRTKILRATIDTLSNLQTSQQLRADHFFHFRCEVSDPALLEIIEPHLNQPGLRLLSLMDHTPGQRQWRNLDIFRAYRGKRKGQFWTDEEFENYLAACRQIQESYGPALRSRIVKFGVANGISLASHDDTTIEDVEQSWKEGVSICEFPTTVEAARRARELGMQIVMGAPNIVLGGSHSGNVSALALAEDDLLDILTSDYVPGSLLHAAFNLHSTGMELYEAISLVTSRPAQLVGLSDRGRIAVGTRADIVRVRQSDGVPRVRGVWVRGRQYL